MKNKWFAIAPLAGTLICVDACGGGTAGTAAAVQPRGEAGAEAGSGAYDGGAPSSMDSSQADAGMTPDATMSTTSDAGRMNDARMMSSDTAPPVEDAGTTPGWGTPVPGGPMGMGAAATVTVNPNTTVGTIGLGFAGFSYEKTHITNDSLTATNTALVALHKLLGSPVIRLGADDVDNCTWAGTGPAPSKPSGEPFTFNIVTGMVDELCSFLRATGSKIIYGVNFRADNVSASAAEAAYVQAQCGSNIYGFEIGNEINDYGSWSSLQSEWESFATAIVATPGALLAGPAAASYAEDSLTVPFAQDESAKFGSKLVLLTQHYYVAASGSSYATAAELQVPDQSGLFSLLSTMNTTVTGNKIPDGYRLGECNTFSGHGQMGVSDTLIAGLWALDLMFSTAQRGGGGVNFHGGETGMDGTRPFYYEPIMENDGVVVQVQAEYYGMLLFYLAGQGPMVSTSVTTSNSYFTAYAIKANGFTSVVLDNKNATTGVNAAVSLGAAVSSASAIYLEGTPAGSLTVSASGVTLAGAQVTATGVWNPMPPYSQTTSGDTVTVYVPPASAALVHVLP
jgi:hypothetical protein